MALWENLEPHFVSPESPLALRKCLQLGPPHSTRQAKSKGIAPLVSQVVNDLVTSFWKETDVKCPREKTVNIMNMNVEIQHPASQSHVHQWSINEASILKVSHCLKSLKCVLNVINSEVANVHAAGVVVVSKGSVPMNLVPRSLGWRWWCWWCWCLGLPAM